MASHVSALVKVSLRLPGSVIARLKRRAREAGVRSWQDVTRRLIHGALDAAPAASGRIYKFVIDAKGKPDPTMPGIVWENVGGAAVAEDEESARAIIRAAAAAQGRDARWLEVADVTILPCAPGTFIMQAWV